MKKLQIIAVTFVMMTLVFIAPAKKVNAEYNPKKWKGFVYEESYSGNGVDIINYKGNSKKLTIPAKIKGKDVIKVYSLGASKKITSVHISNGVEVHGALSSCPNLKKITVSKSNKLYKVKNNLLMSKDERTLYACPGGVKIKKIPNTVERIGYYAFQGSNIESITLGKNVTLIDNNAFHECKNLKKITFNKKLKEISEQAFSGCVSLKKLTLPKSLETIGNYVFNSCTNLKKIVIRKNVKEIGFGVFVDTPKLEKIYIYSTDCVMDDNMFEELKMDRSKIVAIYGRKGSTAEANAKKYKIAFKEI